MNNKNQQPVNLDKEARQSEQAFSFVKTFRPYRKRYTEKVNSAFGADWITNNHYLNNTVIEKAIIGELVAGYFNSLITDVFGIDIDCHKQDFDLFNKYNSMVDKLGVHPSLLFKSPRGLHCYYLLNEKLPIELLRRLGAERLPGVEIRPTENQSLRIPKESSAIDPKTLLPLHDRFELICERAERIHPAFLFSDTYLPDKIKSDLKSKRSRSKIIKALPKIHEIEAESLPFFDGETNDKYCKLVACYKLAGLTESEAVYRFTLLCEQSRYTYSGDLFNSQKLSRRIHTSYSNIKYTSSKVSTFQPSLFDTVIADKIASQYIQSKTPGISTVNICGALSFGYKGRSLKKETKSVKKLVLRILNWCSWHDGIMSRPADSAFFDFLYKFYRYNMKRGYYPIPKTVLRKVNVKYYKYMPFLESIGFLENAPFKYNPRMGICKYFKVYGAKFL